MKKLLIAGNVFFALIIYIQSCNSAHGNEILTTMHCSDYSKENFNGISFETADTMFKLYQKNQYKRIGIVSMSPVDNNARDSKSVWFSLETLKKFIYKIEDTLARQNINPKVEIGIRIYFAAYLDSNAMKYGKYQANRLPANYQFHHTVFMMPTFTKKYGNRILHYDFNPSYPLAEGGLPIPLTTIKATVDKIPFWANPGLILGLTDEMYIQNHGELGPPPPIVEGAIFQ